MMKHLSGGFKVLPINNTITSCRLLAETISSTINTRKEDKLIFNVKGNDVSFLSRLSHFSVW